MIIKSFVSLVPVFLFLAVFLYLDSMKLVNKAVLLTCLGWGFASAGLSFYMNTWLMTQFDLPFGTYSRFVAPVAEEVLKCLVFIPLLRRNRIGFMIDGAIYGFAIGAAFSLTENIFYLLNYAPAGNNIMVWIIRGFGTAFMHGGTMAVFGILCMSAINRETGTGLAIAAGLAMAIFIHGIYNLFIVSPVVSTLIILLLVPLSIVLIFQLNEKHIRDWLELEFDSEINMLRMIRKGQFSLTKTGRFLLSLRAHFPPETVLDIYCFISLYLELSMKAKAVMILQENGFNVPQDPELAPRLAELKALKKNIGRAGFLAISPVLRVGRKDLWKLGRLEKA